MSPGTTSPARLYFDRHCGPCSLFAAAVTGFGHGRIAPVPIDAPEADAHLASLSEAERYGAAHLVDGRGHWTGAELVAPLLGLTIGPLAERAIERLPAFDWPLRRLYRALWRHRAARGCGARPRSR